jgi:hypothetical protein
MPRATIRTFVTIGSLSLVLLGCGAHQAVPKVAIAPTATPTPIKATATPLPATATPIAPTATSLPATVTPQPTQSVSTTTPQITLTIVPFGNAEVPRPDGLPSDWTFYPRTVNGVAFGLPANWEVHTISADPSDPAFDQLLERIPEFDFDMRRPTEGTETVICACDDDFPVLVDVMVGPTYQNNDPDLVLDVFIEALEAMPEITSAVNHAPIQHPAGRAEAVQYRIQEEGRDGKPMEFTGTHYWVFGEDHWVLVSLITSVDHAESRTPVFYKIIQTFQLTPMRHQPL